SQLPVRPEIPSGADILNVGEAPNPDDITSGRPFSGNSGKLLRGWLEQKRLLARSAFIYVESHQPYDLTCKRCGIELTYAETKLREAISRRDSYEHGESRAKPPTK